MPFVMRNKIKVEDMDRSQGAEHVYEIARSAAYTKAEALERIKECVDTWCTEYADGAAEAIAEHKFEKLKRRDQE
jgi:hypothetical protein